MTIGERIRSIRQSKGVSQTELATAIGVSKQNLYKYETNIITSIPSDKIEAIAHYFDISPAIIMGWADTSSRSLPENILPLPPMKRWKVLGGTACGEPIFKELEDESILAPADIDADYVFRCVGDSMINARIFDGDIVFVKSGEYVEDGQIAVVRVDEEYTLKRIYRFPDYLELRAENPMYKTQIIRGDQENAEIVGKAVQFLSRVI